MSNNAAISAAPAVQMAKAASFRELPGVPLQMLLEATPTIIQPPSNQEANRKSDALLQEWISPQVASALFVGLFIGWFAHVLAGRRESKTRIRREKDQFGVFIRERIGELPKRAVHEFYNRTKPAIRNAVQRVGHFLTH